MKKQALTLLLALLMVLPMFTACSENAADTENTAAETTATDFGETLDYWLRLELRSGTHRLNLSICPAAEFGVLTGDCSMSVYSRPFHKTLWALLDKKYNIQKRFDKVVHM